MRTLIKISAVAFGCLAAAFAGNPQRAGQAGATQLLINPWARSSGLNGVNVGNSSGVESIINNPAGLCFTERTELVFARCNYLRGSDININSFGLSQSLGGGSNVIGVYVSAFDFGQIPITTEDHPDGGIGYFSPTFMNLGLSYGHKFTENIFVGTTFKMVHESITDVAANGFALDAGVQYRSNFGIADSSHNDRVKLGVTLRNIGTSMRYSGDGLLYRANLYASNYTNAVARVAAQFEMPVQLLLGGSIDWYFGDDHRFTAMGSFVSNSYTYDQFGLGAEYGFKKYLQLRASLLYEKNIFSETDSRTAWTGIAFGGTVQIPFKSGLERFSKFGVDYSYRPTRYFQGTHVFGVHLDL